MQVANSSSWFTIFAKWVAIFNGKTLNLCFGSAGYCDLGSYRTFISL